MGVYAQQFAIKAPSHLCKGKSPCWHSSQHTRGQAERVHPNGWDCRTRAQNLRKLKVHARCPRRNGKTEVTKSRWSKQLV